jgi:hypothetical protein
MGELLMAKTRKQVLRILKSLPKGLPAVYARMLRGIEADDRDNSKILLTWTALAFRKLSLEFFADILGCQPSVTVSRKQATLDEITVCAPMLQVREEAVEFVHQSAKEYLLRPQADGDPVLEDFRIRPEEEHMYLTRRCLRSLAERSYLQYYSLLNWPKHAKQLHNLAPQLYQQENTFFGASSLLRDAWWQKYSMNFPGLPEVIPPKLHMACFVGPETWARAILLEEGCSGKLYAHITAEECSGKWLALDYAAESGAEDLLKVLLDHTSNGKHSPKQLDSALCRAVLAQRAGAARLLLGLGADANGGDLRGEPLLLHANLFRDRTIERLLLEYGAEPLSPLARVYPSDLEIFTSEDDMEDDFLDSPTADWLTFSAISESPENRELRLRL